MPKRSNKYLRDATELKKRRSVPTDHIAPTVANFLKLLLEDAESKEPQLPSAKKQ